MPNTLGSEYKNLSLVFENLLITSFSLQNIGLFIVNREITNIISNKPQIFLIIAKWSTTQNLFLYMIIMKYILISLMNILTPSLVKTYYQKEKFPPKSSNKMGQKI